MGLPDDQKSFTIGLAVLDTIPVCDGQTDASATTRRERPRYAERRTGKKKQKCVNVMLL